MKTNFKMSCIPIVYAADLIVAVRLYIEVSDKNGEALFDQMFKHEA